MSVSLAARLSDPYDLQTPQVLQVQGSKFGLVAFQQGGPREVSVMVGGSPRQYLDLLHGVICWAVDEGIDVDEIVATMSAALSKRKP